MHLSPKKGEYNFKNVPFDDQRVWNAIGRGLTKGAFQIESNVGRYFCKNVKPQNISELSDVVSLGRPGPMQSGQAEEYIKRRQGIDDISYYHPSLESILNDTQGVLVYQEQVLKICSKIAGFSETQSDLMRSTLAKKKPKELAEMSQLFIEGCKQTEIVNEEEAQEILRWIQKCVRYLFNKSHGVSYAINAYHSMYAKVHFPTQFYCAWLTHSDEKPDPKEEVYDLVTDAKLNNVNILSPDITNANLDFDIIAEGKIAFGIRHIRGIGEKSATKIIKNKEKFVDWQTFIKNIGVVPRNVAESLIKSGACDRFDKTRNYMIKTLYVLFGGPAAASNPIVKELTKVEWNGIKDKFDGDNTRECLEYILEKDICVKKRREIIEGKIKYLDNIPEDTSTQKAIYEKIYLGLNITCSAVDDTDIKISSLKTCRDVFHESNKEKGVLCSVVDKIKYCKTGPKAKNPGEQYCYLTVSDNTGALNTLVVWPNIYKNNIEAIYEGAVLKIKYHKDNWKGRDQIVVDSLENV